jgi:hypothetical protein
MVTIRAASAGTFLYRIVLLLVTAGIFGGCAAGKITVAPSFKPVPDQGIVYVVPFVTTFVPEQFNENVFNTFVDDLNGNKDFTSVRWFYIAKEELHNLDPEWLKKQVYVTGELWSYIEDVGCCSAVLRVKSRVRLFEAGKAEPSLELFLPLEHFFDFTKSTLEAERVVFAYRLADEMAAKVLDLLAVKN